MATQFPEHRTPPRQRLRGVHRAGFGAIPTPAHATADSPCPHAPHVVMPTPPGPSTAYGNYHRIYAPLPVEPTMVSLSTTTAPLMTSSLTTARRHPDSIMDLLAEVYAITHEGPGEDPGWGDPVGEDPPAVDSPLIAPMPECITPPVLAPLPSPIPLMGPIGDPSMVLPPPLDLGPPAIPL